MNNKYDIADSHDGCAVCNFKEVVTSYYNTYRRRAIETPKQWELIWTDAPGGYLSYYVCGPACKQVLTSNFLAYENKWFSFARTLNGKRI